MIRWVNEVYPLYMNLSYNKFINNPLIGLKVKESKDFVGLIELKEQEDPTSAWWKEKGVEFAILYATLDGATEMANYFESINLGNRVLVPEPFIPIKLVHDTPVYSDYCNLPEFKKWLANRKSEKNDIVILTQESYDKIMNSITQSLDDKKILISDLLDRNLIPLPSMTLKLSSWRELGTDYIVNYSFDRDNNILNLETSDSSGEKFWKIRFNIYGAYDDEQKADFSTKIIYRALNRFEKDLFETPQENDDTFITHHLWMFFYVNYFIRVLPTTYKKKADKIVETFTTGKGIYKKTKNRVVLKTTYNFDLNHYSIKHIRHEFKCLCWGVRGHYRHMANGKVVFVKPFRKGKERNNFAAFKEKEYEL